MPRFTQIHNEFKHYLKITNRAKGTIENYLNHLNKFYHFIKPKSILKATQEDIHKFHLHLENLYKVTTIDGIFASLSVFYNFAKRKYEVNNDIQIPKNQVPIKNGKDIGELTVDEFRQLVEQAEKMDDKRFIALITTLIFSGMRISEVLQLKVSDVGNDYTTVIGKGKVKRTVYIGHQEIKKALKEYHSVRKTPYASNPNEKALFVGERGPLTRQAPHYYMKKYAALVNVDPRKAHCHITRHTFVKMCLNNGLSLHDTADLVGHRDISSTRYYLEKSKEQYSNLAKKLQLSGLNGAED